MKVTTNVAAERLGITPRGVVTLIKRGLIAAKKPGRDWQIEEAEVERYARERRPQHRPRKAR
jgi:excisionase family DNA binding protein